MVWVTEMCDPSLHFKSLKQGEIGETVIKTMVKWFKPTIPLCVAYNARKQIPR